MSAFRKCIYCLSNNLAFVAGFLIFLICFLSGYEAVTRNIFGSPTRWTLGISQFLLLYSIFLGTAYCFLEDGHIRVEILLDKLSNYFRRLLLISGYVISGFFFILLVWKGFEVFAKAYRYGWRTVTAVQVPTYLINVIIPVGSIIIIGALIVKAVEISKGGKA